MMTKDDTLNLIREHGQEIRERFGVKRLAVFGSTARGEAREDSDVDVLVEFREVPNLDHYFGLIFFLEDLLGRKVDLVQESLLIPDFRPYIEEDAIEIA